MTPFTDLPYPPHGPRPGGRLAARLALRGGGRRRGTAGHRPPSNADDAPRGEFSTAAAAVGDRSLGASDSANAVRGVVLRPSPNATCPQNESAEPAFLLALRLAYGIGAPLQVSGGQASHYIDPRVARQLAATRSVDDLISRGERQDCS